MKQSEPQDQAVIDSEEIQEPVTNTYGLPNFGGQSQLEYDDMMQALKTVSYVEAIERMAELIPTPLKRTVHIINNKKQ